MLPGPDGVHLSVAVAVSRAPLTVLDPCKEERRSAQALLAAGSIPAPSVKFNDT